MAKRTHIVGFINEDYCMIHHWGSLKEVTVTYDALTRAARHTGLDESTIFRLEYPLITKMLHPTAIERIEKIMTTLRK